MAVSKAEVLDLADKLQGRVKFYHVGDPHRKLLQVAMATLRDIATTKSCLTAESVQNWLQDQGIKLTKNQLEKMDQNT